jgi:hypothetical protein
MMTDPIRLLKAYMDKCPMPGLMADAKLAGSYAASFLCGVASHAADLCVSSSQQPQENKAFTRTMGFLAKTCLLMAADCAENGYPNRVIEQFLAKTPAGPDADPQPLERLVMTDPDDCIMVFSVGVLVTEKGTSQAVIVEQADDAESLEFANVFTLTQNDAARALGWLTRALDGLQWEPKKP